MSLELLNKRLQYSGGDQEHRMIRDKLISLKRALLYSYQAATAKLADNRQFKCLINPDKNKPAYDNKILSIPYEDICLTTQRQEKTKVKTGDVFLWKETNTHWLIYLQFLEEDAYFRSQIRRCDQMVDVDGKSYWVYLRGPVQTSIEWTQKAGIEWNTLNYSLVMYITADDNTEEYFERFKTVKIIDPRTDKKKTWQVVGVDPYYGDGIIQVFLDEYFENSIEDAVKEKEKQQTPVETPVEANTPYIDGPTEVTQYSKAYYSIKNISGGHWYVSFKDQQQDLKSDLDIIPLNISTGELGEFTLIYRTSNQDITLKINIKSL